MGEPLLHPEYVYLVHEAANSGMFDSIMFISNAMLLEKGLLLELFSAGLTFFELSFSGHDADSYNKHYIGGDFYKAVKNITAALSIIDSLKLPPRTLRINGIVDSEEERDKTYTFLTSLGFQKEQLHLPLPNNLGGQVESQIPIMRGGPLFCHIMATRISVLWDGKITLCGCLDFDGRLVVGDIKNDSFSDIRRGDGYQRIKEAFRVGDLKGLEMCNDCNIAKPL